MVKNRKKIVRNGFYVVNANNGQSVAKFDNYDKAIDAADNMNAKAGRNDFHVVGVHIGGHNTQDRELKQYTQSEAKRGRGRPPGSKNKAKNPETEIEITLLYPKLDRTLRERVFYSINNAVKYMDQISKEFDQRPGTIYINGKRITLKDLLRRYHKENEENVMRQWFSGKKRNPQRGGKITRAEAKRIAEKEGINFTAQDFFDLRSTQQTLLARLAKESGYRKSASAPGSTGRMFFEHLAKIKNPARSEVDVEAAKELYLFAETEPKFSRTFQAIYKNLATKKAKGTFVKAKAAKIFAPILATAAKEYSKQYGDSWTQLFSKATRDKAAEMFVDAFDENDYSSLVTHRKNAGYAADYNKGIDEISKMFQGRLRRNTQRVAASDLQPAQTARLGMLKKIIVKNPEQGRIHINFNGDALLSADRRKNLYVSGNGARIENIELPKTGLMPLGELIQVNYITDKKHIESGRTTEFYHPFGELNRQRPKVYVDHEGFLHILGGDYDIWREGIVN